MSPVTIGRIVQSKERMKISSRRAKHDEQRFAKVFEAAYPDIYRFVRRRLSRDVADDVTNSVFERAWSRWSEIEQPELPWLYAVARNIVGDHLRASQWVIGVSTVRDLTSAEDVQLDRNASLEALRSLDANDQETLMLVGWENLSAADCAQV